MADYFLKLKRETDIQVQELQGVPNKMNPKRPTQRDIIIKMAKVKDKERILKAIREIQKITYKGTPTRLRRKVLSKGVVILDEVKKEGSLLRRSG